MECIEIQGYKSIKKAKIELESINILIGSRGYDKVSDGINLSEKIGLRTIMAKCPRFANWINTLKNSKNRTLP